MCVCQKRICCKKTSFIRNVGLPYFLLNLFFIIFGLFFAILAVTQYYQKPVELTYFSDTFALNTGFGTLDISARLTTNNIFSAGNPINIYTKIEGARNIANVTLEFPGSEPVSRNGAFFAGNVDMLKASSGASTSRTFMTESVTHVNNSGVKTSNFAATTTGLVYNAGGDLILKVKLVQANGSLDLQVGEEKLILLSPIESLISLKLNDTIKILTFVIIAISLLVPGLQGLIRAKNRRGGLS